MDNDWLPKGGWKVVACAAFVITTPTAGKADFLFVKTLSTQGAPVSSVVEMSIDNAPWSNIEGEATDSGTKIFLTKCDGSVRFKAFKRDRLGFYTRSKPDDVRFCTTPEVVFNDYVPTAIGQVISPDLLGDPNAWKKVFGFDNEAAKKYADAFRDALGKGDYGYVAIATSEVAASLRKAGSPKAAYPFETLSLQSTMTGILEEKGLDPDDFPVLEVKPGSDRLALTPKAQDVLVEYQKTVLGFSPTSKELGKAGWTTMKSLAGGDEVKAAQWNLQVGEASKLDQNIFAPAPM
jgi:hypothetical protein